MRENAALLNPKTSNWDHRSPLDRDVIERLRAVGREIEVDVLGDVLDAFRTSSEETLVKLVAASAARDSEAVRATAHGLKGSSFEIGASRVAGLAAELENLGRAGDSTRVAELVSHLEPELARFFEAISKDEPSS